MGDEHPEHIQKWLDKKKRSEKLLATTQAEHSNAYSAAQEVLKDEEGLIDYKKLKDSDVRQKFIDKLVGHYITKAAERFHIKDVDSLGEHELDALMQAYIGVTKTTLEATIDKMKDNYTQDKHEEVRKELLGKTAESLNETTLGHFKEEHIEDLVKYSGVDWADHTKMTLNDALGLASEKEAYGQVRKKPHEGKRYFKKTEE